MANSVLVTGASTGFGPEIAFQLATRGFKVFAGLQDSTRQTDLEKAAAKRNVQLHFVLLDETDQHSIDQALRTIIGEGGGIYGVVNNAVVFLRGYFEDLLDTEVRRVFETNLFGTMAVTRAVLPHMRTARRGRVVIVSSVAGRIGAPSGTAYSASRFAQEGFAECLYQEVRPLGIHVSLIEPGITPTESWATIQQNVAVRAREPQSPYYASFTRAEQLFDRAMKSSPLATQDTAKAVLDALTARHPRLRYLVGRRANLLVGLRRYIPGEVFERLYFGLLMRHLSQTR